MKEIGVVQSVEKGGVLVKLKRHAACLGCRACSMASGGDMLIRGIAEDSVKIGDTVLLGPNVLIGKDCQLGDFCELTNTILFNNIKLGKLSKLKWCIIDDGVELPENYQATSSFITIGEKGDLKIIDI